MAENRHSEDEKKHRELFENLKIAIFDSSFNYKLLENLQQHIADLIEFQSIPDLPNDMQNEADSLTKLLAQLTKSILDFQKRLIVIPLEEGPNLTVVK